MNNKQNKNRPTVCKERLNTLKWSYFIAIISAETKASSAPTGNNKGLRLNLSNQQETYQSLQEHDNALLIMISQTLYFPKALLLCQMKNYTKVLKTLLQYLYSVL